MFGTERRCARTEAGRPRFNELRRGLVLVRRMYITIAASCKEFYKGPEHTRARKDLTHKDTKTQNGVKRFSSLRVFVVKKPGAILSTQPRTI